MPLSALELSVSPPSTTEPKNLQVRDPLVLTRAQHPISRKDIDEHALRVLYRLSSFGCLAYLVGGSVRDLFLQRRPKDFDIATDARPSRLKKIFKNCRIIGRRFRIAHVYFPSGKIIEVSTFRRGSQTVIKTPKGTILSDNEYGSPQEDALRRDLTINGLFYDIESFSVIDYVGGVQDLRERIVRTIADPDQSFLEDPVRMIRVLRHASRTGFHIEPATLQAIHHNRDQIRQANTARLLEENLKDLKGGAAAPYYRLLLETQLLDCLVPSLAAQLQEHGDEHPFWSRMQALDRLVDRGATFTNPLLLSVQLHTLLFRSTETWLGTRNNPPDVWRYLSAHWRELSKSLRISRRDVERITQILISLRKLVQSYERKQLIASLHRKPYLSEALDFLEIVLLAQGKPTELLAEWRKHAPPPPLPEPRYRFFEQDSGDAPSEEVPADLSLDIEESEDGPGESAGAHEATDGATSDRPPPGGTSGRRRRRRGGRRRQRKRSP